MATQDFKRKLAAILHADVKGYSRLMGEDEGTTVSTLTAYREVMGVLIKKHRGRTVHGSGDSLLAEFTSVVEAVQCAVEIQNELKTKNAELSEDRRVEFRIGINLGDVIEKDEDLHGDGVNIAARVESLADGGGICITRSAYDQVKKKLPLGYEYLGEHSVKNITEPVRVYRVLMDPEAAGKVIGEKRVEPKRVQRVALAVGIVLLLVVGGLLIWRTVSPPKEVASVEKMAFPLPDKPSIAVLPFDNMSDDPKQEYFSDGITEEIITSLSKVPQLFVIARNSTFTYKNKPVKIQQVAEELGVRYVLEGSVRKSGKRVRVTAQLIDAITGSHLWADRYDRELKDIFAVQDEVTKKIITALQVRLTQGEQARTAAKGTSNLEAYLKIMQARVNLYRANTETVPLARQLAEEAIALDPGYATAYRMLGVAHMHSAFLGISKSPKQSVAKALELVKKALELDDTDGYSHAVLGFLLALIRQYDKAVVEAERGVALDPNVADIHAWTGSIYRYVGRWEEAILAYKKAIRLNPIPPGWYSFGLGLAYGWTGRYEEAITECQKAVRDHPNSLYARMFMTLVYSFSGRSEEARTEAAEVLRINPKFNLENWEKRLKYKNKDDQERFINTLRKAGLPDKPPLSLPDKPSIAVLPFENMSDDPKQEYFSDGITDDLITDLSKISGIFVIARNSTFTYKGKPIKVQQIARELGVRYVLEGSVRKAANQVRINAQLIDATTGHHLWAERYDGNLGDIFALQDKFTRKIVSALAVKLTADDESLLARKGTDNVEAYDTYLRGLEHVRRNTRDDIAKAVEYYKKAIELDPDFTRAHASLAGAYQFAISRAWYEELGWPDARSRVKKHLEIAMKNPSPLAHYQVAKTRLYQRRYDEAISEAERAIALDPNYPDGYFMMGWILTFAGRSTEAIDYFKRAMRLDPNYPGHYLYFLGLAQYFLKQYEEAATTLERSIKLNPHAGPWALAITYAQLGRGQEAADILAKYFEKRGWWGSPIEDTFKYWPIKEQKDLDHWVDGLRKSGLMRPWNPVYRREYEKAIAYADQAITLNPNDAKAQYAMGESLVFAGRSAEAVDYLEKAMSLNPKYPANYLFALGLAQFCQEKYEEAASSLERALYELKMGRRPVMWLLAATYAHLGRQQEAEEVLTEYMKKRGYKGYTVEMVLKMYLHAFKDPKNTERFAQGLQKAGLPME